MPSVMVTGAWSNLGQAIVDVFHKEGYTVYGTARTPRQDSRISRCYALDLSGEDIASMVWRSWTSSSTTQASSQRPPSRNSMMTTGIPSSTLMSVASSS